jgi:hypothetical protein
LADPSRGASKRVHEIQTVSLGKHLTQEAVRQGEDWRAAGNRFGRGEPESLRSVAQAERQPGLGVQGGHPHPWLPWPDVDAGCLTSLDVDHDIGCIQRVELGHADQDSIEAMTAQGRGELDGPANSFVDYRTGSLQKGDPTRGRAAPGRPEKLSVDSIQDHDHASH